MVQFAELFINFIAGVWTIVFENTLLDFGSFDVSLGDIIIAGLIVIMCINLFWKGAKS